MALLLSISSEMLGVDYFSLHALKEETLLKVDMNNEFTHPSWIQRG